MKRLRTWLTGYLILCLVGGNTENFLSICAHHGILVRGVSAKKQGVFLRMSLADYKRIGPIARKAGTVPYVYRRVGFPFLLAWGRKHPGFLIGAVLFALILGILQQYVWVISVDGNFVRTEEQIVAALRSQNVYVGCKVKDVTCAELEEYLRNTMTDIIWVSCEKDGTKLRIHVKEAYRYPQEQGEERETGDIVATKSGVVTELVVRHGVPVVSVGTKVNAGDVLVSGTQILTDAYDVEIGRTYVLADANVTIEEQLQWDETIPMTFETKEYDTKTHKKYGIRAFGHEILQYQSSIPEGDCDIMTSYADLRLFSGWYLPVQVQVTSYETFQVVERTYTEEEASVAGRERYLAYLEKLLLSGYEISEEWLQMTVGTEQTVLHAEVVASRASWKYADIVREETPGQSEEE